jgi:hypothetical protein
MTLLNAGKYNPRDTALTSQRALIFRNVAVRTSNFALKISDVAIADLQTFLLLVGDVS